LRNIAVGLGNGLRELGAGAGGGALKRALEQRRDHPSALVREHVAWALTQCGMPAA
jgi:epoxyqueuosine reductase